MMSGKLLQILLALICLLAVSCTSARERRIADNAAYFSTLPPADQNLIKDGKVRLGMTKESVVIALGKPARVGEMVGSNGKPREIWTYQGYKPVYSYPDYYAFPLYDRYGRVMWHRNIGPEVSYVPYSTSRLVFLENSLTGWEKESTR